MINILHRLASRPAVGIGLLATALALFDLGRRILATNDEARFAVLAQDILTRGAWFFPELNGVVYQNKPLLQAWLIALASWPLGHVTQFTAVLPSALAGVGTVLVIYVLGRDMFGTRAGCLAALAATTTQGWFLHSRLPMPDMLLTFAVTASLALFWWLVQGKLGRLWLGFYGLVGFAFWTKGVAGLMPLAIALVYAVAAHRLETWRTLHLPAGLALVAVLVAPWWVRHWLFDVGAFRSVVVDDNLAWYLPRSLTAAVLTGPLQHLVGILFPWVLVAPAMMWQAARTLRQRGPERDAVYVLALASVVILACVATSEQQRLRYYVPLLAPVSLLIGWWCANTGGKERALADIPWRIYGIAAALIALATLAAFELRPSWGRSTQIALPTSAFEVLVMAAGLLLLVGGLTWGMRRGVMGRAFALAWIGSALWVGGWYHWELDRRNAAYDYPRVQAEAIRLLPQAPLVAAWGIYELPFSFYFDRRVVSVASDRDLHRVMSQHPGSSAVLTGAALAQVEDPARLRVLPLDRLNFDSLVLVTYTPERPTSPDKP